eukprot:m51a1_g3600 hypothetical protein (269) ;mRNA; f:10547-11353
MSGRGNARKRRLRRTVACNLTIEGALQLLHSRDFTPASLASAGALPEGPGASPSPASLQSSSTLGATADSAPSRGRGRGRGHGRSRGRGGRGGGRGGRASDTTRALIAAALQLMESGEVDKWDPVLDGAVDEGSDDDDDEGDDDDGDSDGEEGDEDEDDGDVDMDGVRPRKRRRTAAAVVDQQQQQQQQSQALSTAVDDDPALRGEGDELYEQTLRNTAVNSFGPSEEAPTEEMVLKRIEELRLRERRVVDQLRFQRALDMALLRMGK